jgi:hypothetical protein
MRETPPLGTSCTRVSVSRVKPSLEFKIDKLSFVNFEFYIYSNKP